MAIENLSTMNFSVSPALIGVFAGLFFALLFVFIILMIVLYVYQSFAYMAIARRAKLKSPGLAWIPGIGPAIIAFKSAKMHWWPWLLLIGCFIPKVGVLFSLAFTVFSVIWSWKMFGKVGRPGWWAILCLIPIVNLVMIGIAAWGKNEKKKK